MQFDHFERVIRVCSVDGICTASCKVVADEVGAAEPQCYFFMEAVYRIDQGLGVIA